MKNEFSENPVLEKRFKELTAGLDFSNVMIAKYYDRYTLWNNYKGGLKKFLYIYPDKVVLNTFRYMCDVGENKTGDFNELFNEMKGEQNDNIQK